MTGLHQFVGYGRGGGEANRHPFLAGREPQAEGDVDVAGSNISSAMFTNLCILLDHLRTTWALFHSRIKLLAFNCAIIRPHNKSMRKSYDKYRRSIYPPKNKGLSLTLCDGRGNKSNQHCNYKNFQFTTPCRPYSLPPVDHR